MADTLVHSADFSVPAVTPTAGPDLALVLRGHRVQAQGVRLDGETVPFDRVAVPGVDLEPKLGYSASDTVVTASSVVQEFTASKPAARETWSGTSAATMVKQTYVSAVQADHRVEFSGRAAGTDVVWQWRLTAADGEQVTSPVFEAKTLMTDGTGSTAPTPTPVPSDPPPTTKVLRVVSRDTEGYPTGTGVWAHLPHYREWRRTYHLPPSSTKTLADCRAIYGHTARSDDRVIKSLTINMASGECGRIYAPERFVNPSGQVSINGGNHICYGHHFYRTRDGFNGDLTEKVYYNSTQANAKTGGMSPTFGRRYYPNDPVGTAKIVGDAYNRAVACGGNATGTSARVFRAYENFRIEGDWFFEGFNWGRGNDSNVDFRLYNFRHDRVSVTYSRTSTGSYTGKAGGDAFQFYDDGAPRWATINGFMVPASSIQVLFGGGQNVKPTRGEFRRIAMAGADTEAGVNFVMWYIGQSWASTMVTSDLYVKPSTGTDRGGSNRASNGSNSIIDFSYWSSRIKIGLPPTDFAPANEIGIYSNPQLAP